MVLWIVCGAAGLIAGLALLLFGLFDEDDDVKKGGARVLVAALLFPLSLTVLLAYAVYAVYRYFDLQGLLADAVDRLPKVR